jgi:ATP-binding cassette, subfamily B, bacterial CvaB/MchF/RaxB
MFRHLIRLPITYFEKRHIGDLLSRFSSLQPIRNLLAEGLVAAARRVNGGGHAGDDFRL